MRISTDRQRCWRRARSVCSGTAVAGHGL